MKTKRKLPEETPQRCKSNTSLLESICANRRQLLALFSEWKGFASAVYIAPSIPYLMLSDLIGRLFLFSVCIFFWDGGSGGGGALWMQSPLMRNISVSSIKRLISLNGKVNVTLNCRWAREIKMADNTICFESGTQVVSSHTWRIPACRGGVVTWWNKGPPKVLVSAEVEP